MFQTDRYTDGQTDERTDARLIAISPKPFGQEIKEMRYLHFTV